MKIISQKEVLDYIDENSNSTKSDIIIHFMKQYGMGYSDDVEFMINELVRTGRVTANTITTYSIYED